VPVGITGTRHALAKDGLFVRSARVLVSIGAPLVQSESGHAARDRMRHAVRAALVELSGSAA